MATAYIMGEGVPCDLNKALEVYPDPNNPVCEFNAFLKDGSTVPVRELLFGKDNIK